MTRYALLAALLAAAPVQAQGTQCAPRPEIVKGLADGYGEVPVQIGLGNAGLVVEVFASEQGTWTITVTSPQGMTCLIASGEAWQAAPVQGRDG